MTLLSRACVSPYSFTELVPFIRYSASKTLVPFLSYLTFNDIMILKSGLKVSQVHSNWYHSKVCVRFPIRLP